MNAHLAAQAGLAGGERRRFGEPAKFVPVLFLCCTITLLYCIFTFLHCVPQLQSHIDPSKRDQKLRNEAIAQLVVFNLLVAMLIVCYLRCVLVHPGAVPEDDAQWEYLPQDNRGDKKGSMNLSLQETKRSGDRRHCKWCGKYKPDRCHHCRVCRCCVLKMDHHCPWLYNCVGFRNYKFFFLWLFYCVLTLHFIYLFMFDSVKKLATTETTFVRMFLLLFGQTLSFSLGLLVTTFWGFHIWLMLKAMTTIEFCEKSMPKKSDKDPSRDRDCCSKAATYNSSVYDLGAFGNIKAVLGDNPFLLLLPVSPPKGDGLNFVSDDTRLTRDLDVSKGLRRKTHRRTQRNPPRMASGYGAEYRMPDDSVYYGWNNEYGSIEGGLR